MVLGGVVPQLTKTLRHNDNLQLIHKECHNIKTNRERTLYKYYRQVRSKYIEKDPSTGRKTVTPEATLNAFIEIYQENEFKALQLDPDSNKKLKTIFNVAKRLIRDKKQGRKRPKTLVGNK